MKRFFIPLLFLFSCFSSVAQNTTREEKYKHQLQLVDSVRDFIKNELHLTVGSDFYNKWATGTDSVYQCLFASRSDRVESVIKSIASDMPYGSRDTAASTNSDLKIKDYQTLLYKTAGLSCAELSQKLLNYPDEAIAFIMVHEAVHRHILSLGLSPWYPYDFEECLCDAMANTACIQMAKKSILNTQSAVQQKQVFEDVFSYVDKERAKLNESKPDEQVKIFKECTARLRKLMLKGNQFQKDRISLDINNAWFARIWPYAEHYFEVRKMLEGLDINTMIAIIYKREVKKGPDANSR